MRRSCRTLPALTLLALTQLGCRSTNLPEERPPDLRIRLSNGGGMYPAWEGIEIQDHEGVYTQHHEQAERSLHFELSEAELDALYQAFRENRFDCIETYEEQVYDRGGTSIGLGWGATHYDVSNGGMEFIEDSWRDEWSAVVEAVNRVAGEAIEAARVPITIALDASLAGRVVSVSLNFRDVVETDQAVTEATDIAVDELPGEVMLSGAMQREDGSYAYLSAVVEVAAGRRFTVGAEGNDLAYSVSDAPGQ